MTPSWYILYTRPRSEKKVADQLMQLGYTVYLPVVESLKQWSDRKKKVKSVLFPSYLFIYGVKSNLITVLEQPGIVKFVTFSGSYAIVRDQEIEAIKRLISTGSRFEVTTQSFIKGDKIKIIDGPLCDLEGFVISRGANSDFIIYIDSIYQCIKVSIPNYYLKKAF